MGRYILRRILLMIPVILGVTVLIFTIIYFTPGDAADVMAGLTASEAERDAMRHSLGLDRPYIVQLGSYLYQVFIKFDLGTSIANNTSIASDIADRFPRTMIFALISTVLGVVIGVPLGVYAATHQNKVGDYLATIIALFGNSLPAFWVSLLLVLLFAYKLHWLPAYGIGGVKYYIIPVLSNCLRGVASNARQSRSSMLEVINSDYVKMARAKGLPERDVIFKHALPNALMPIVTMAGGAFGAMLGGGMVIEQIFAMPGMGYYLVQAITARDYPAVQGSVILLSIAFSIVMLITDLAMGFIDPRIKAQFATPKGGKKKNA